MKFSREAHYFLGAGAVLLAFDQLLKFFARSNSDFNYYLYRPWLGWEYFENTGIAFGLSVPTWLLIILTPVILILFLHLFLTENFVDKLAILVFLIPGALSNFIDRVLFGVTIDYIRIFTSLLNLADFFIVLGISLLIFRNFKQE
ncbi:MAG: signal peptidase II [Candidatus Paceibacteria bacterium]